MAKSSDRQDRLADALRENLKRRKARGKSVRDVRDSAPDDAGERPVKDSAGKPPIDPRACGEGAAVPESAARPNPAGKTS